MWRYFCFYSLHLQFYCQDTEQSACYLTYYLSILLALFSDLVLSSSVFVPVWLSAVQNTWLWTGKHPGVKECQKWYKQQQRTGLASLKCYEYLQIKYQVYLHCSNALTGHVPVNKAVLLKKKCTAAFQERKYQMWASPCQNAQKLAVDVQINGTTIGKSKKQATEKNKEWCARKHFFVLRSQNSFPNTPQQKGHH